jgi:osmoprotectant transport system permease protein
VLVAAVAWAGTPAAVGAAPSSPARSATGPPTGTLTVGSKAFPESWILAEALVRLAPASGVASAKHGYNLGGTEIVYQALRSGAVDVYPEYTGTIAEVILHRTDRPTVEQIRAGLAPLGLAIGAPLGFNDSYAIAVSRAVQERTGVRRLSDLAAHPELRLGLTHEFMGREDGWPGLARRYGLRIREVRGIQHELAYGAIASGKVDAIDIYTTDAQIEALDLRVLEDDRGFFPRYDAVWLYRLDLADRVPTARVAMERLEGRIDETAMIRANGRVAVKKMAYESAAESLLREVLGPAPVGGAEAVPGPTVAARILANTAQHLRLVAISLLAAILVGIPLGLLATHSRPVAAATLSLAGLLQTIPSLALLAFLIPLLGIGVLPALVALFLYSLLPIVRNTYVGITTIPTALAEAAAVLGLSPGARLWRVDLPMASPAIMAGIKTSAVINVGTATLAALIGAGGLGEPILSGITLRRHDLILQGAIPAAALALLVQWGFDLLDRAVIPRGLRLRGGGS